MKLRRRVLLLRREGRKLLFIETHHQCAGCSQASPGHCQHGHLRQTYRHTYLHRDRQNVSLSGSSNRQSSRRIATCSTKPTEKQQDANWPINRQTRPEEAAPRFADVGVWNHVAAFQSVSHRWMLAMTKVNGMRREQGVAVVNQSGGLIDKRLGCPLGTLGTVQVPQPTI